MQRTLFVYWGRRGAMSWFALELTRVLNARDSSSSVSISSSNELAELFANEPLVDLFPTFSTDIGIVTRFPRFISAARNLMFQLKRGEYQNVVVLMPHLWSPFFGILVRRAGLRYCVVVHDAQRHPGDPTGIVNWWLLEDARRADVVVTLSKNVSTILQQKWKVSTNKVLTLFHPVLTYGDELFVQRPREPLRVLFFGRILPYKGLDLLIDAVERVRAKGIHLHLGVIGEGNIHRYLPRLRALGADVVNQWVDHRQVAAVLAAYDVVALPYTEASQSGTAAAALGGGLPVIATRVGGLIEQVRDGVNGLLADATAESYADSLASLAQDKILYFNLRDNCLTERHRLSMTNFLDRLFESFSPVAP